MPLEQVIVVRAILDWDDGRSLYVERSPDDHDGGRLCLVGGKLEPGEAHLDGIVREVEEEIGQTLDPDLISYAFSQEPVERKGGVYRTDYFHVAMSEERFELGPDERRATVLNGYDAIHHPDIAYGNGIAHHFFLWTRLARIWHLEWRLANEQFQETGTIPKPTVYAPSLNPISERSLLAAWMRESSPFKTMELGPSLSDIGIDLIRHGRTSDEAVERSFKHQKDTVDWLLDLYCDPRSDEHVGMEIDEKTVQQLALILKRRLRSLRSLRSREPA